MIKFWAICKNTFVQTIRQPVYGILILVTFAVLLLSLALSGWTMSGKYHASDQKMLENLGLSTLLVSGLLVAAFSASSVLSREIEDRTALTVISKPVARATFVLGKFGGVLGAVAAAFYLCGVVFLLTVRHRVMPASVDPYDWPVIVLGVSALSLAILTALAGNFFFGWSFISTAIWSALLLFSLAMGVLSFVGKEWAIVPLGYDTAEDLAIHVPLLVAMGLIFMAVMVFVAVAVAASTRLGQVMTLLVCCGVFFVGSMHAYLFGHWVRSGRAPLAGRIVGAAFPKLTYFFPLDALMKKEPHIPASYVTLAGAYCALYVGGILAVGMALFERRQLEVQSSSSTMPGAVSLLAWTGRVCAVGTGLVALVLGTLSQFHTVTGVALIVGLLIAAAGGWMLWTNFGAGVRRAYWVAMVVAAGALGLLGVVAFFPQWMGVQQTEPARVITVAGCLLAVAVVAILILPKTRRHFRSSA